MAGLKNLEEIHIYHSPHVTDAGLAHLNGLKTLRTLLLSTQVTDAGIERLRRTLPGVKVRQ